MEGARNIILGVFVFALIVLGLGYAMVDLGNEFSNPLDTKNSAFFSNLNSSSESARELAGNSQNSVEGSKNPTNIDFSGLGVVITAIKLPFQMVGAVIGIITDIFGMIGIPSWILGIIIGILLIVVTWEIIKAVRGLG